MYGIICVIKQLSHSWRCDLNGMALRYVKKGRGVPIDIHVSITSVTLSTCTPREGKWALPVLSERLRGRRAARAAKLPAALRTALISAHAGTPVAQYSFRARDLYDQGVPMARGNRVSRAIRLSGGPRRGGCNLPAAA